MRPIGRSLSANLGPAFRRGVGGRPYVRPNPAVNSFTPLNLVVSGRKLYYYDAMVEGSMYLDYAGTSSVSYTEGDLLANVHDLGPLALHASRLSSTSRPALRLFSGNGSYRRAVDYTGGKSLNLPFPNLGSNCTIARARPGIGAAIGAGQTISGALNDTTNFSALVVSDNGFTTAELALLTPWLNQRAGMQDLLNQSYGSDPDEVCDVFRSNGHPTGAWILLVHGGGWRTGSKASPNVTKNKLQHWLWKGITVVSMNYPMSVGVSPIAQAGSVAKCMSYVQRMARSWGLDPTKGIMIGHSAGGHLITLTTCRSDIQGTYGMGPWLGNLVLDSAGYNLVTIMNNPTHLSLYDEPWNGGLQQWQDGSPTYIVTDPAYTTIRATTPPMWLVTSTDSNPDESDPNVGPFKDQVLSLGRYAEIYNTAYVHADTNIQLGAPNAYTTAADAFMATYLGVS